MKKYAFLVILTGIVASASAYAYPSASDSWDTIRAADGIWIGSGTAYDAEMGGIFNICTDGQNLKTIQPIQTCLAYSSEYEGPAGRGSNNAMCTQYGTKDVVVPLVRQRNTCLDLSKEGPAGRGSVTCGRYGTETVAIPTTVNLEVGVQSYTDGAFPINLSYQLFFKPYTIPSCASAGSSPSHQ